MKPTESVDPRRSDLDARLAKQQPSTVTAPAAGPVKSVDLSVPTEESPSEPLGVKVRHQPHAETVHGLMQFFGCTERDLPEGLGWANDSVELIAR